MQTQKQGSTKRALDPATYNGRWTISAPEYLDYMLTPRLTALLRDQCPHATLQIVPPNPAHAERMLETGELDLRLGWVDQYSGGSPERHPPQPARDKAMTHAKDNGGTW
jgi:DNA-binding transcriptional LysR family regulator